MAPCVPGPFRVRVCLMVVGEARKNKGVCASISCVRACVYVLMYGFGC